MRKWLKRTLLTTAALTTMAAGLSYWLLRGEPDWYHPGVLNPAQREALAKRAEDALIGANNWADQLKAREARVQATASTQPSNGELLPSPSESHSVAFSEDELNALFQKWSQFNGWNERLAKYVTDPVIALRGGNLILAGKMKDIGAVASFHFKPEIDPSGQLQLTLVRVMGGKLPLPKAIWNSQRDRMTTGILARLPAWQAGAAITPDGSANQDAILAAMGQTMLDVLNEQPADANVFIQNVPVRVTELTIIDEQLTSTVAPLTFDERASLLRRIRSSSTSTTAPGKS